GLRLAKNGAIAEEDIDRKTCTVSNNAHGKAFELLGTAAYHALFEFGSSLGLPNAAQYEILLSDPRKGDDIIEVALMSKHGNNYKHYDNSPHQRKPDLVLTGNGVGERYWVELKSWRYNSAYLRGDSLNQSRFPFWNGYAKATTDNKGRSTTRYTTNAHRQHFLDYVATRDSLLTEYWAEGERNEFKPAKNRTWFQIWEPGIREWRQIKKEGDRYVLGDRKETINVATPWITPSQVSGGVVRSTTPQFRALQKYLTS